MSDGLRVRDRDRWWSPYLKCCVEGTVTAIGGPDECVIIQRDSGAGPTHSPHRESRYTDGASVPDEASRQKRRDYLKGYRKRKRAGLREACR
jgi:hypothetical protein